MASIDPVAMLQHMGADIHFGFVFDQCMAYTIYLLLGSQCTRTSFLRLLICSDLLSLQGPGTSAEVSLALKCNKHCILLGVGEQSASMKKLVKVILIVAKGWMPCVQLIKA
eukprot:1161301-Pelagomonas_calceolata.AAC.10